MSTRGAVGFRINGQDKTTYNHSDSYPSWLGVEVLKFCKEAVNDIAYLKSQAANLQFIPENRKPNLDEVAICMRADTIDLSVSERKTSDWYCLTRKSQGNLAKILEIGFMSDGNSFLLDSLFCEWAYIINLDSGKLEVYKGFNHGKRIIVRNPTPDTAWVPEHSQGRYATDMSDPDNKRRLERNEEPYFGVYLVAEFGLKRLPTVKGFLKEIASICGEE